VAYRKTTPKENTMNTAIEALIRTAVADLEPRIQIAQTNVDALYSKLSDAETELAKLTAERNQLVAGLPAEPEGSDDDKTDDTDEGTDSTEVL
jgi:predicted  nucleic acid-binding Zn-ribbon protein